MQRQASLWQDESQSDERPIHLGDRFQLGFCWADGDTAPDQLARLARLNDGELSFIEDTQGRYHPIRILRAWVDEKGKCVRGLCEAIRCPLSGRNTYDPNEQQDNDCEDEEI